MTDTRRVPLPDARRRLLPAEQEWAVRRARELGAQPEAERAVLVVRAWWSEQEGAAVGRSMWVRAWMTAAAGAIPAPAADDWARTSTGRFRQVDRLVPAAVEDAVEDLGILGMTVSEVFPVAARGAAAEVWVSQTMQALTG